MNSLGIGMIGYGGIGRVHAMGYRSLPYHYGLPADTFRMVGVATTREATAKAAAAEIGCTFWTDDYRALLARPDVDVVDICVPNRMHAEIVTAAAAAGKHIYCEKPLAMTVAEGKQMVEAANRAGVKTQMTFNFRFFPALIRARQLMDEGFLGRIFLFPWSLLSLKLHRPPETAFLALAPGHVRRRRALRSGFAHSRRTLLAVG